MKGLLKNRKKWIVYMKELWCKRNQADQRLVQVTEFSCLQILDYLSPNLDYWLVLSLEKYPKLKILRYSMVILFRQSIQIQVIQKSFN